MFCFSGNGMSRLVADGLAKAGVGQCRDSSFGFVFPVYGWRPPRMVARFVRDELAARLDGTKPDYVWAVMTCGFDVGYADAVLDKMLLPVLGRGLDAAFSVRMPDTYICLPGFRLNSPGLAEEKMRTAESLIPAIAARIKRRERVRDLKRGIFPRTKTHALGWFFDRFLVDDRFFRFTPGKCERCGTCAENCPAGTIVRKDDGTVAWRHDGSCTGCLRCLHNCPAEAIEFGWFTKGKRRLRSSPFTFPCEARTAD